MTDVTYAGAGYVGPPNGSQAGWAPMHFGADDALAALAAQAVHLTLG